MWKPRQMLANIREEKTREATPIRLDELPLSVTDARVKAIVNKRRPMNVTLFIPI